MCTYLGIHLHQKLLWELHANFICGKANCLLRFMKRNLYNYPVEFKEFFKNYCYRLLNTFQLSGIFTTKHQLANYQLNIELQNLFLADHGTQQHSVITTVNGHV